MPTSKESTSTRKGKLASDGITSARIRKISGVVSANISGSLRTTIPASIAKAAQITPGYALVWTYDPDKPPKERITVYPVDLEEITERLTGED